MSRNHVKAVSPESQAVTFVPTVLCVFTPFQFPVLETRTDIDEDLRHLPLTLNIMIFFLLKTFLGVLPNSSILGRGLRIKKEIDKR